MFSHVLSVLGEERREALLEEARRARLARAEISIQKGKRRLAWAALAVGHALIELGARLHDADEVEAEAV